SSLNTPEVHHIEVARKNSPNDFAAGVSCAEPGVSQGRSVFTHGHQSSNDLTFDEQTSQRRGFLVTGERRSAAWFGETGRAGMIYRSWMRNQGFGPEVFDGRPVI